MSVGESEEGWDLRKLEDLYMVGGADVGGSLFFCNKTERARRRNAVRVCERSWDRPRLAHIGFLG